MTKYSFPKVTVITVCYNAAETIENTIRSVNEQDYILLEHVIIDGASTDNTINIIKEYRKESKLRFISEPDNGIYDAMNKGIKASSGEWIIFLGSDDIFFDTRVLKRMFSRHINNEEILYGNVKFLHSGIIYDGPFDEEKISKKNICHQSILFRKSIFHKMGFFNLKYKIYADYEFNLRWIGAKIANLYVEETLVTFNEKGISGHKVDDVFNNDFENLLIESNIISTKSFLALKKKYSVIIRSNRFKVGNMIMTPLIWIKNKLYSLTK